MKLVDISGLYSVTGGGIRTYVRHKLIAAERLGHDTTVIVPGYEDDITETSPITRLVTVKSPRFPLDRNYGYFENDAVITGLLERWPSDFIECSSPWLSANAVAAWPGPQPRALIMHADPFAAWAYRWFEGLARRETIDRGFDWYWRHLRRLDKVYGLVVCASEGLRARLAAGGIDHAVTIPMGVEPGFYSPDYRDPVLRARLLERMELPETGTLLLGIGRFSPEKRWPLVIEGVQLAGYHAPVGLVMLGDGHARSSVLKAVGENPHILPLAPIRDRQQMAAMFASADFLIHGAASETFGMVQAEALASGLPIIVPDEGAAVDHVRPGAGLTYATGDAAACAEAILAAIADRPAMQAAARAESGRVRTMDEHFDDLYAAYDAMLDGSARAVA